MAKLAPIFNDAQLINGIPANGAKLFTYVAGSSTKQTTYSDEAGTTPQANPIILDSRGEPAQPIWLTEGASYKFVFSASTDTDPPTSPIRTIDNVTGINDATVALSQWVDYGITPTYVSATSFTLPGDQTSQFQVNRRFKATVTAGTVYGYIATSAFGALTTVTVVLDSGVLDTGLSRVELGLITPANTSLFLIQNQNLSEQYIDDLTEVSLDLAQDFVAISDTSDSGNKKKAKIRIADKIQPITASVASNALTITLNPTTLDFRDSNLASGTVNTRNILAAISVVVSSGSTLGTVNAVQNRLAVLAIDNAGTVELAVVNMAGLVNLDETGVISTTAEGGAGGADSSDVIYSTTARNNVPYRVVGFVESTQATAGTWATAPSRIQGYGGQAFATMSGLGYGQTWQNVTRVSGTTYYNTTGKPITYVVSSNTSANNVTGQAQMSINGLAVVFARSGGAAVNQIVFAGSIVIPAGAAYTPTFSNMASTTSYELR